MEYTVAELRLVPITFLSYQFLFVGCVCYYCFCHNAVDTDCSKEKPYWNQTYNYKNTKIIMQLCCQAAPSFGAQCARYITRAPVAMSRTSSQPRTRPAPRLHLRVEAARACEEDALGAQRACSRRARRKDGPQWVSPR